MADETALRAAAEEFVVRLRSEGRRQPAVIGKVLTAGEGLVSVVTRGERQNPEIEDEGPMEHKKDEVERDERPCCGPADPHTSGSPEAAESCCPEAGAGKECCPGGGPSQQECCPGGSSQEPCCPGGGAREACCPTGAAAEGSAGAGVGATEEAWKSFMKSASAPGALDVATKQAVNVALALAMRCGPCTKTHIKKALAMGFTPEEIDELAWQATSFGGCAVKMFYNQFRPEGGGGG